MNQLLLIFIGGGLGSLTRFSISKFIQENIEKTFPFGTLGVNVLASIVLGIFVGMVEVKSLTNPNYKALIAIGFCGGFSTFSTFSNDTLQLIQNNRILARSGVPIISILIVTARGHCPKAEEFKATHIHL